MEMNENPYQAPESVGRVVGVKSGRKEDLQSVARYQRGILVCILFNIIAVVARFAVPGAAAFILVGLLVVGLISTVFVFLLSIKVYNTALGILIGLLTLVPCIGLLMLLIVNSKATRILTENGYHVGLLGVSPSQLN